MVKAPKALTDPARFFSEPTCPRHRQYEALRAFYLEGLSSEEAARRFGYKPVAFRVLCWRFVHQMREFFQDIRHGPQSRPHKDAVRETVVSLRKKNYSVYDIRDELEQKGGDRLGVTAIRELLREEGFARLPRRADDERPKPPQVIADEIADVRAFSLMEREFSTRAGGIFLLVPLLVKLNLDELVVRSAFPGTKMIPATHAVRSALLLKLLGKARRSHGMDLVLDPGIPLATGLNAIPKATYMSQYSGRLGRKAIARLLGGWVDLLKTTKSIDGQSLNLDFHSIRYFGEDPVVEKHYVPRRSQKTRAVLAFLAQDPDGQLFCYSNADLRKGEEAGEILRFAEFWKSNYGSYPEELVFDSKLTTQPSLSRLNEMNIRFITLRARQPALKLHIATQPRSAWQQIELDIPHRRYKTPKFIDERVTLEKYKGALRQLLIKDLGHEESTVLITNDLTRTPKALITRYARRMLIENGLADAIDFFHLDALSSAVALNVDFDVLLTVIGSGIYRMFAGQLRGYERQRASQIFRRFLDTSARVRIRDDEVVVQLVRRSHNPVLIDAGVIGEATRVPWWGGRQLRIEIV